MILYISTAMIRNLILDFGNVFVDLDQEATVRTIMDYGVKEIPAALYDLALDYEKGQLSTTDFVRQARTYLPGLRAEELIHAWNAILLDMPEHRLEFLRSLSAGNTYNLILLSNSNALHLEHLTRRWGLHKMEHFLACFDRVYFSHEMGMRKPDAEIFLTVLEREGLQPEQTFFVDDTAENIYAAAELGLLTWHLKAGQEDITELQAHLP